MDSKPLEKELQPVSVTGSATMSLLRAAADYVQQHGLDAAGLFEDCGIPASWLAQPSRRIGAPDVSLLLSEASRQLNDPLFGVHLGQHAKPWHCAVLGYLVMCSETLDDALQQFLKYEPIVDGIGHTRLQHHGDTALLIWTAPGNSAPPRQLAEAKLSAWFYLCRWLNQNRHPPRSVQFQHAEPETGQEPYERLFQCPVYFDQPQTALQLDRPMLERQLSLPDPMLRRILEARADSQLDQLRQRPCDSFAELVKHHLKAMLHEDEPSLGGLTQRLHISARTLQRRLSPEGYSYKSLLDEVRHDLALQYIESPGLPLHTISALLGFSDQSAFQRAFKRWTGSSPGQYREQLH